MLYIYPLKKEKKTFDANKEELGFASKPKVARRATIHETVFTKQLTEEDKIELAQQEFKLKSKSLGNLLPSCQNSMIIIC